MKRMPRLFCLLLVLLSGAFNSSATAQGPQPDAAPVNPDATPAARALLREIDTISGHATLSGQHNFPNTVSRYSDRLYELTNRYPALFGQDFGFSGGEDKDSTLGRSSMIQEVIRQYRAGAVIALTWHAVRPTEDEPVTFRDSVQGHLTDWEWQQVLTPGTDLYLRWARQVDVIAGYLRELQDAGVPVLFRPYHEMNGNWFWWGGRPGPTGSAALYRQLYDRYVHRHHLNNLVWVWNVNSPSQAAGAVDSYFPGAGYADVLTMDIYGAFDQSYYDSMVALAGSTHPIALAEVGAMPSLDVLAKQPRWAYFMMWSGMAETANTPEQLAAVFHAPNVIARGDARLSAPLPAFDVPPAPGIFGASAAAKNLLARLYRAGAIESSTPGDGVSVTEVDVRDQDAATLLPVIRTAAESGQAVFLRWIPPRPTDHANGMLTDFEWRELLKPGTDLHTRWTGQVDSVARLLQQLQAERITVLWSSYPQANAHEAWWAGRPGPEGSAGLLRMLHERLTDVSGIRDVVWNWEPAMPGFGPNANGQFADFFPGPLFCDTFTLDLDAHAGARFPADRVMRAFSGGKPFGLRVLPADAGAVPTTSREGWHWVIVATATQP